MGKHSLTKQPCGPAPAPVAPPIDARAFAYIPSRIFLPILFRLVRTRLVASGLDLASWVWVLCFNRVGVAFLQGVGV